jgi:hypothetical protein
MDRWEPKFCQKPFSSFAYETWMDRHTTSQFRANFIHFVQRTHKNKINVLFFNFLILFEVLTVMSLLVSKGEVRGNMFLQNNGIYTQVQMA